MYPHNWHVSPLLSVQQEMRWGGDGGGKNDRNKRQEEEEHFLIGANGLDGRESQSQHSG